NKKLDAYKKTLSSFQKAGLEFNKTLIGTRLKIKALAAQVQNTDLSLDYRKAALNKLKEDYGDILNGVTVLSFSQKTLNKIMSEFNTITTRNIRSQKAFKQLLVNKKEIAELQ